MSWWPWTVLHTQHIIHVIGEGPVVCGKVRIFFAQLFAMIYSRLVVFRVCGHAVLSGIALFNIIGDGGGTPIQTQEDTTTQDGGTPTHPNNNPLLSPVYITPAAAASPNNSEDNNNSNEEMSAYDFQVASQNEYANTSIHTEFSIINEPFVERVGFFMRSGFINRANRSQVEFAIVIEAASLVTEGTRVSTAERDNQMKTEYIRTVDSFPNDMFESVGLKTKMRTKFTNAQKDIDGATLWKKFVLVRKDIRSLYLTKLPRDASSLASGTNWRDAYDAFILQAYKLDKVSNTIFVLNLLCLLHQARNRPKKISLLSPSFNNCDGWCGTQL